MRCLFAEMFHGRAPPGPKHLPLPFSLVWPEAPGSRQSLLPVVLALNLCPDTDEADSVRASIEPDPSILDRRNFTVRRKNWIMAAVTAAFSVTALLSISVGTASAAAQPRTSSAIIHPADTCPTKCWWPRVAVA